MPFQAQPTEKCTACGKTVYLTEKAVVEEKTDKKVFHKQCIRCSTCNKVLTTGQYSSMDGQFWCKPHFKQLFATKGNYDEAFGKEKASSKWEPSVTTAPTSFVPDTQTDAQKEKKPTSEATMAKFRQMRADGDSDKCSSCAKTVYHAEKLLVEDKNEKRTFHKQCFKCTVCGMILDLRSYGSAEGKIYCKNHLKEKQTADAASRQSGPVVSPPSSFIPSSSEEKKTEKGQTPENIASKFRGAETEKCKGCGKSVYATEKVILPESFKQQSIYHKACLKCSVCQAKLDVSTYGSANGTLFCHTHLKQYGKPEQAKGDYFISPLANANTDYVAGPREDNQVRMSDDEQERPRVDSDRERESDRDRESDRESYDRRRDDEADERASSDVGGNEREPVEDRQVEEESHNQSEAEPEQEQVESRLEKATLSESEPESSRQDDRGDKEAERQRRREERQRQQEEEERQQEAEREKRRRERERRAAEAESLTEGDSSSREDSGSSRDADRERRKKEREEERRREEEERERQDEKRRKEREDKRREQEEETKRELEEQERKAEERRRKLAELRGED